MAKFRRRRRRRRRRFRKRKVTVSPRRGARNKMGRGGIRM